MTTIELLNRRFLGIEFKSFPKIFALVQEVDEKINDSVLIDRVDEQIVVYSVSGTRIVGREIVGNDPAFKLDQRFVYKDFSPTMGKRDELTVDDISLLEEYIGDYRILISDSGKLIRDSF